MLLERRAPQVAVGTDLTYGMGLRVDRTYGAPVVRHGGSMIGYKSDMFWLPEQGVGAVMLTNSDAGQALLAPSAASCSSCCSTASPRPTTSSPSPPGPCASGSPPNASC